MKGEEAEVYFKKSEHVSSKKKGKAESVTFPSIAEELACRKKVEVFASCLSASSVRLVNALGEGLCLIPHCIPRHWLCARNDVATQQTLID